MTSLQPHESNPNLSQTERKLASLLCSVNPVFTSEETELQALCELSGGRGLMGLMGAPTIMKLRQVW